MLKEELIYQYLDGSLDEQSRKSFEVSLATDTALAEEVDLIREMRTYGTHREKEKYAHQVIHKVREKYRPNSNTPQDKPKASKLTYIIVAIAAVALLAFLLNRLSHLQGSDGPALYAQYNEVTPLSLSTRSMEYDKLMTAAERSFNDKKYEEAITSLTTIIEQNPDQYKAMFYRGYAYIANGSTVLGREDLSSLLDTELYKSSAQYHIALSYLKSDELSLALPYLEAIPENSNYHARAQEILKVIR